MNPLVRMHMYTLITSTHSPHTHARDLKNEGSAMKKVTSGTNWKSFHGCCLPVAHTLDFLVHYNPYTYSGAVASVSQHQP